MIFDGIDFETKDPYIGLGLGAGTPFAINFPADSLFFPIGWSHCVYDSEQDTITRSEYYPLGSDGICPKNLADAKSLTPNFKRLLDVIKSCKNFVAHNASYDLGCLLSLNVEISHLRVYDTKVIARLYDSNLWSYSLDPLLKKYFNEKKFKNQLVDVVKSHDLLKTTKGNTPNTETKTYEGRAEKWAYSNMDIIQRKDPQAMAVYANQDTAGMMKLFRKIWHSVGDRLSAYYSNIQYITTDIRMPGITVDLEAADKAKAIMIPVVSKLETDLFKLFGSEFNLYASKELAERMVNLGYDLPTTDAGNYSASRDALDDVLEENPNDPLCVTLGEWRTVAKLLKDFIIKIQDMQPYTCPSAIGGGKYGRVFPELNLLAARTGRFSSSNPNIQNIPKRNKEFAKLCRALFVPSRAGNDWFSLDWSNQEGRLQLHYGYLKGFRKTEYWLDKFKENPKLDTHSLVAEMMGGVDRNIAKTIYLGKSFCMGRAKTAKRLGLPTEYKETKYGKQLTSGIEATRLIDKYEEAFPYLTELQKDCSSVVEDQGYIRTLGGRRCQRPPRIKGKSFDYKAISLLIQGSAADQMYEALTQAHRAKIDIKCIVHDEFNIEGNINDAKKMQEIMEHCIDIVVPSIAEIKVGKNWGNLEELNDATKNNN